MKGEKRRKIIKIENHCLLFSPTAKHSRDLHAHKIKRITAMKRAVASGNVLDCTKTKKKINKISYVKEDPGL